MAKKVILGTDIARDAFKVKVNENFTELYDNSVYQQGQIEDKLSTSHNTDANAHDDIRESINSLVADKAKFAVFTKTTNQSIASAASPQIIWENKQSFNDESFCKINSATGQVKILESGIYEIVMTVRFATNSTGDRSLAVENESISLKGATYSTYGTVSTFAQKTNGALINCVASQVSSASLDILSSGTTLKIRRIVKL